MSSDKNKHFMRYVDNWVYYLLQDVQIVYTRYIYIAQNVIV